MSTHIFCKHSRFHQDCVRTSNLVYDTDLMMPQLTSYLASDKADVIGFPLQVQLGDDA